MTSFVEVRARGERAVIRRIANSIVPVAWMTLKAPPISEQERDDEGAVEEAP